MSRKCFSHIIFIIGSILNFSIITVNYGMNTNSYYNVYVLPINPKKKLENEIGNNICTPRY